MDELDVVVRVRDDREKRRRRHLVNGSRPGLDHTMYVIIEVRSHTEDLVDLVGPLIAVCEGLAPHVAALDGPGEVGLVCPLDDDVAGQLVR